jgi:hypothetical protein
MKMAGPFISSVQVRIKFQESTLTADCHQRDFHKFVSVGDWPKWL